MAGEPYTAGLPRGRSLGWDGPLPEEAPVPMGCMQGAGWQTTHSGIATGKVWAEMSFLPMEPFTQLDSCRWSLD